MIWATMAAVAIVTALATRLVERWATAWGLLDIPVARSSHQNPTPRGGGMAIALIVELAWVALILTGHAGPSLWPVLGSGGLVAAVGLIDDRFSLSPGAKLGGQIAAAMLFVLAPWTGGIGWGAAFVLLWVLTYTNLFNFMDGSDGLAAGIAGLQALTFAALAHGVGRVDLAVIAAVLAAGSLGFLTRNYPPATIFMGDVGSLFLGCSLATLSVELCRAGVSLTAVVLTLATFLFDGLFTLARRAARGERVWEAHRSHLYQRLLGAGRSKATVAHYWYAGGIATGALALLTQGLVISPTWALLVLALASGTSLWLVSSAERQHRLP